MKEPTKWPHVVKNGNARVTIYRVERTKKLRDREATYVEFRVGWFDAENKRETKNFTEFGTAHQHATTVTATITKGDAKALTLTEDERLTYLRGVNFLRALPGAPSLDLAIHEYAEAKKLLGAHSLRSAAEFFAKNCGNLQRKTVNEVVDELVALREVRTKRRGQKASEKYITDLKSRLGRLTAKFPNVPIESITSAELSQWIDDLRVNKKPLHGRTRFNYLRIVGTLFRYAKDKRYYPRDVDPLQGIESAFEDNDQIEIFTPDELARLLKHARREMVPFLALCAFGGLRHNEVCRLDWSDINFKEGVIEVAKHKAKTRSNRVITMQPNLLKWLAPYREDTGKVVRFTHVSNQIIWLCQSTAQEATETSGAVAPVKWRHNALRHSFVTYRMCLTNNENLVAAEAGNSPQMIHRNYRRPSLTDAAKAWFSINPLPVQ